MRRAAVVLVLGVVLLGVGFAWGTSPRSTDVSGTRVACGSVVPTSWLVPGATRSPDPLSVRRACDATAAPLRWAVGGLLGLGALLVLVGWTAAREVDAAGRPAYVTG